MKPSYGTTVGSECTVQVSSGNFCSRKAQESLPFPICLDHAIKLHAAMTELTRKTIIETGGRGFAKERTDRDKRSVVYYIDLPGDMVKIGYTTNLDMRRKSLRVDRSAILATEPGGQTLERKRHAQFSDERIGQRENFQKSDRLMNHIASLAK